MKIKPYMILITVFMILCCCTPASCEDESRITLTPGEDWSWSRGAYNSFSGRISIEGCTGEITACLSVELPYDDETDQQEKPVFTSVNGKRIVMAKQSDTVHFTADADHPELEFSASVRLPEKKRISSVPVTICISDAEGKEITAVTGRISSGSDDSDKKADPFYIPADISLITAILAATAVLIWMAVLIRGIRKRKNNNTGER